MRGRENRSTSRRPARPAPERARSAAKAKSLHGETDQRAVCPARQGKRPQQPEKDDGGARRCHGAPPGCFRPTSWRTRTKTIATMAGGDQENRSLAQQQERAGRGPRILRKNRVDELQAAQFFLLCAPAAGQGVGTSRQGRRTRSEEGHRGVANELDRRRGCRQQQPVRRKPHRSDREPTPSQSDAEDHEPSAVETGKTRMPGHRCRREDPAISAKGMSKPADYLSRKSRPNGMISLRRGWRRVVHQDDGEGQAGSLR